MPPSESITLSRDCDCIEIPSGTHKKLASGTAVRIMQSRGGSYTITTDLGAMYRIDAHDADALGLSGQAHSKSSEAGPLNEQMVADELKTVFDPEIPVNIVDLGLVYSCVTTPLPEGGNRIDVKMTMTAPGCGMGNVLKSDVESKLSRLPEVKNVNVEIVFDPPWHPGLMSEAAKLALGLDLSDDSPLPMYPQR